MPELYSGITLTLVSIELNEMRKNKGVRMRAHALPFHVQLYLTCVGAGGGGVGSHSVLPGSAMLNHDRMS